jgi:hypothetical protein
LWLQERPIFLQNEIPDQLIKQHLFPRFANETKCPHSWEALRKDFRELSGVKRRKTDGRRGADSRGASRVLWKIPRPHR